MGEIGEYWRDVKAHRKQQNQEQKQKVPNPPRRRCYDWIIVSGTSHYAKNRSSFKAYQHITPRVAGGQRVIGVGTVELQVETSPTDSTPRTLVIKNVLHIPEAICNGYNPMLDFHAMAWGKEGITGLDKDGEVVWYAVDFCGLRKLVLAGNPQGESEMQKEGNEGVGFMLSLYATEEELSSIRT